MCIRDSIHIILKALNSVGVNTKAVLDFDVLNSEVTFQRLFEALGGDWNDIKADYKQIKKQVESKRPELNKTKLIKEVNEVFESIEGDVVPRFAVGKINGIMRKSSPWMNAKNMGEKVIPAGDPRKAWKKLHIKCLKIGLHIIEYGQIESFVETIGGHGSTWVNSALERDLVKDPELSMARKFVNRLYSMN